MPVKRFGSGVSFGIFLSRFLGFSELLDLPLQFLAKPSKSFDLHSTLQDNPPRVSRGFGANGEDITRKASGSYDRNPPKPALKTLPEQLLNPKAPTIHKRHKPVQILNPKPWS